MSAGKLQLEEIAGSFARSAAHEFRGSSPLYEKLSMAISGDHDLLVLASCAISKPVPMIFLAAVHYLLLNGSIHSLAAFYPDIHPEPCAVEQDPYPLFRDFCIRHSREIENLITSYHVQTNEVRRCACLLPAFGMAAKQSQGFPLTLVEIGASAGLNLLWDHYGYDYGNGTVYGNRTSPVQLTCTVRGDRQPPFPEIFPQIASRIGIDLNPIDVRDKSEVNWLMAFIWPEHTSRFNLLHHAIEIATNYPPDLRKGDVLDLLPGIMEKAAPDSRLCLFHTFVSNQMSPETCRGMMNCVNEYGKRRDCCCISIDLTEKYKYPRLELLSYTDGVKNHRHIANCSGHSRWLEWCEPI
jgi:hypothetical protein